MDHWEVVSLPLNVVRSTEARSIWKRALKPILKELKFRPGKYHGIGGWNGWTRDAPPFREFFWIQINRYGFDRYTGGEFLVEFELTDSDRQTGIRERMWRLLDIESRLEVIRMNNQMIERLPGPSRDVLEALPKGLTETYLSNFETMAADTKPDMEVWFRYATSADVEAWGEFLASRLKNVIESSERRLENMPDGVSVLLGTMRNAGEEKVTSLDE
jgi:hypothetical protein